MISATISPAVSIYNDLSDTQFLNPHTPVDQALLKILADRVSSPDDMNTRLLRAGIDHHASIGRLKREDLLRISNEIAELALQTASDDELL